MDFNLQESSIHRCPHTIIDRKGRPVLIKLLDKDWHDPLIRMYLAYRPRNSFNGLPPIQDEACKTWVEDMIETGMNLAAISFSDGIVGHSAIFPMRDNMCELMAVMSPGYQQVGIGSQLTRCAIQLAYEAGFEKIWLSVESRNHIARHVYSKCGFKYLTHEDITELEMTFDLALYHEAMETPVSKIMNRDVISVGIDTSCREAVDVLLQRHIASLPVVDVKGKVVGILSETDLITPAALHQRVSDVFTRDVATVRADTPISRVIRLFESKRLRYTPVIDGKGKLLGIVGRRDVLRYYHNRLNSAAAKPQATPL